jgi:hypothetical protein
MHGLCQTCSPVNIKIANRKMMFTGYSASCGREPGISDGTVSVPLQLTNSITYHPPPLTSNS